MNPCRKPARQIGPTALHVPDQGQVQLYCFSEYIARLKDKFSPDFRALGHSNSSRLQLLAYARGEVKIGTSATGSGNGLTLP